jgi:uncharacterized protein YegJ (DUF2314 family)
MNAAMDKARATVGEFIAVVQKPKRSQSSISVKAPFTKGKSVEHMWVAEVTYDGRSFHDAISNEPEMVTNYKMGQRVSFESSKISDWMYVENGKLVGGFTLRVLRDAMSAKDRAEFDSSVPFTID